MRNTGIGGIQVKEGYRYIGGIQVYMRDTGIGRM